MLLSHLRKQCFPRIGFFCRQRRYGRTSVLLNTNPELQRHHSRIGETETAVEASTDISGEIFPTTSSRVVPMVLAEREPIVLPFDDVPGPSSLKLLSKLRQYLTSTGTQLTVGALTLGVNIGSYVMNRKPTTVLSALFDAYGPVVRFVSPVGGDIVLINHPYHIQQVFATEGEYPVRSMLDCLEKYRTVHRNSTCAGLYNLQGKEWHRQRNLISEPLHTSLARNISGLEHVCDNFVDKVYNTRNCHDELSKNLNSEVHKWAFDCMGYLIFSKKFTMLNTEIVYSQCDMSWLYHGLEKATEAILKCESGLQMWKVFPTLAWNSLVKHCDIIDNLIGKYVMEADQKLIITKNVSNLSEELKSISLISSLLISEEKLTAEDISTILMDMLLLGVNTVSSSMTFLMYYLAKHQKVQRILHHEIESASAPEDISQIKQRMPYLTACIKETLRLAPPIPVLTRVLPKNVVLDRYNIPRGTLIIMSTQDASLKESNFDDATKFDPSRWMKPDSKDYHAFASVPFGFGSRKCLGQNIAETMISMLAYKVIQKFKMEYHYGDVQQTSSFIVRPKNPLKIRFVDRM